MTPEEPRRLFAKLKEHNGHEIRVVEYDDDEAPTMAVECGTCGCTVFELNTGGLAGSIGPESPIRQGDVSQGDTVFFEDAHDPRKRHQANFRGFVDPETVVVVWNGGQLALERDRVYQNDGELGQLVDDLGTALLFAVKGISESCQASGRPPEPKMAGWLSDAKDILRKVGPSFDVDEMEKFEGLRLGE